MAAKVDDGKMFVVVQSTEDSYGWNIPYELHYDDEKFEIKDPIRSVKLFNNATKFKCVIDGRGVELFNEEDKWWLIR